MHAALYSIIQAWVCAGRDHIRNRLTGFAVGQVFDGGGYGAAVLRELLAVERVLSWGPFDRHCAREGMQARKRAGT